MANLFKLVGQVFVDTDKAEKSLKKTDEKAQGLGGKLLDVGKKAAKFGAAAVAGAGAAAGAIFGVAQKAAASADEIDKMSQKIGLSREAYQELGYVMELAGADIGIMQTGMKSLRTAMDGAAEGTKSQAEKFKKLGISVKDANGKLRSAEDVMFDAMAAMQCMDDETQKAVLAQELFGKSGTELMPMLNQEAGSIDELRQRAHDLGIIMGDDAIDAGVVFTDTMSEIKRVTGMLVTNIGSEFMPMVQAALDWVMEHMPQIQEVITAVFDVIGAVAEMGVTAITTATQWITDAISNTGITFGDVVNTAKALWDGFVTAANDVWVTVGKPMFDVIQQVVAIVRDKFKEIFPVIRDTVVTVFNDLVDIWNDNLKPCFDAIIGFLNDVFLPVFEWVFDNVIGPVVSGAFESIVSVWKNVLKPALTGIIDFLTDVFSGDFTGAFQGILDTVGKIFSGLRDAVKTPLNAVIGVVNNFIRKVNTLKIPDWVPLVGGKGVDIPTIPLLAKGGHITGRGTAIVGEQGPEMLELPPGATVRPLTGGAYSDKAMTQMVEELKTLRTQLADDLARAMGRVQVVTDTGLVVGWLAPEIDQRLNDGYKLAGRGVV